MLAFLGLAVHVLLPQFGELGPAFSALSSGRWPFLLLAVIGSSTTYVAGAFMVRVAVDDPPPLSTTIGAQVAATTAATLTPAGLGWIALNERFLVKHGIAQSTARVAMTINMVLTLVSHIGLLVILVPLIPTLSLPKVPEATERVVLDVTVVVAVLAGIGLWIPRLRSRVASMVRPFMSVTPSILGNPKRTVLMIAAAVGANVAYGLALYWAIAAFGGSPSLIGVLVGYLIAATVAAVAPTPGGLGAMEAALVAALTRLGVPTGEAVAGALAFRLATFWLPLAAGAVLLRVGRSRGWL
jgi:undecaprenyl-diphosphatase